MLSTRVPLRVEMDRVDGAPFSGFLAPASWVPGVRLFIDLLAPSGGRRIVAVVPLHRHNMVYAVVQVLVLTDEVLDLGPGGF